MEMPLSEANPELANLLATDATISIEIDDDPNQVLAQSVAAIAAIPSAEIPSEQLRDPYGFELHQAAHSAQHSTALAVAAALLETTEVVQAVVAGRYRAHNAVAIATDKRVLVANDRHLHPKVTSIDLEKIDNTQRYDQGRHITVQITAKSGEEIVVGSISHPASVQRFLNALT